MKAADIEVGVAYMFSESNGRAYRPSRCFVLDKDPIYTNSSSYAAWNLDDNRVFPLSEDYRRRNPRQGRMLIILEQVRQESSPTNPDTGQPWTDEELGITPLEAAGQFYNPHAHPSARTKMVVVRRSWHPWAARPANIKGLWEVEAAHQRAEAQRLVTLYRTQILQQERQLVEREEKAEQSRRDQEQRKKERAIRDEFYEKRLEPFLVELGVDHRHDSIYEEGKITLTYEQMQKLLHHVKDQEG